MNEVFCYIPFPFYIYGMIRPPFLQPGDTIGITCPARKISYEDIQPAIDILENWGFRVVVGDTVGKEEHQYSGSDAARRADFQSMLNNKDIKAILAARGGYGTVRIMDDLDFSTFMNHPKWIAGYSDITHLHELLNCNIGVETLHCTMPINMPTNSAEALSSLRDALTGQSLEYRFPAHPLNKKGTMRGEVVGGNLSILYSNLGTKTILDTNKKILFLEDLDEYLYHVDRMMMAMKRAHKLNTLAGIIVGGMSDMKDNTLPFGKTAEEIIREHADAYDYPVCFGFPAGHFPDNRSIFMGRSALVQVGDTVTFRQ